MDRKDLMRQMCLQRFLACTAIWQSVHLSCAKMSGTDLTGAEWWKGQWTHRSISHLDISLCYFFWCWYLRHWFVFDILFRLSLSHLLGRLFLRFLLFFGLLGFSICLFILLFIALTFSVLSSLHCGWSARHNIVSNMSEDCMQSLPCSMKSCTCIINVGIRSEPTHRIQDLGITEGRAGRLVLLCEVLSRGIMKYRSQNLFDISDSYDISIQEQ